MPFFVYVLLDKLTLWLFFVVGPFVGKLLAVTGIGFVTFTGFDYIISRFTTFLQVQTSGIPSDVLALMNLAGFDQALSMLIGAHTAAFTIFAVNKATSLTKKGSLIA